MDFRREWLDRSAFLEYIGAGQPRSSLKHCEFRFRGVINAWRGDHPSHKLKATGG